MKMPPITPYGVPIRQVIDSDDKELMRAMLRVSDFFAQTYDAVKSGDWAEAHEELRKAAR